MVGLVFSAQAVGLIIGPLAALALLGGGAGPAATWRILLGLGAIPAAAAVWLRRKMPEPPATRPRPPASRSPAPPCPRLRACGRS
jgi:PHS family inorganic phosphate transporter-like MFS transporter